MARKMDDLDVELERQFGDFQFKTPAEKAREGGGAFEPPAPAPAPVAGAKFGERGFNYQRATPGKDGRWAQKTNPKTGMPFGSYAEWAEQEMPGAYASSKVGRGMQDAPSPDFGRGSAGRGFSPPPMRGN